MVLIAVVGMVVAGGCAGATSGGTGGGQGAELSDPTQHLSGSLDHEAGGLPLVISWDVALGDFDIDVSTAPEGEARLAARLVGTVSFAGRNGRNVQLDGTGRARLVMSCRTLTSPEFNTPLLVAQNDPGFNEFVTVIGEGGEPVTLNWNDRVVSTGTAPVATVEKAASDLETVGGSVICEVQTSQIRINGARQGDLNIV
jgi:hypothetical protein